jgi:hypothetical protein
VPSVQQETGCSYPGYTWCEPGTFLGDDSRVDVAVVDLEDRVRAVSTPSGASRRSDSPLTSVCDRNVEEIAWRLCGTTRPESQPFVPKPFSGENAALAIADSIGEDRAYRSLLKRAGLGGKVRAPPGSNHRRHDRHRPRRRFGEAIPASQDRGDRFRRRTRGPGGCVDP